MVRPEEETQETKEKEVKYSLVSDLHLDHPQVHIPVEAYEDVVVVAGDSANGLAGLKYMNKLRRSGHVVIACDGNHEHYSNKNKGRSIRETTERFNSEFPSVVDIDGLRFIQVNGWYYVEDEGLWAGYMTDGGLVGPSEDVNTQAELDAMFVYDQLLFARQANQKVVITTHTAPSEDTLNKDFDGHFSNVWYMNPRMANLRKEFHDTILVWNHGHTHAPADQIVDGVRTVCNPRGYPRENPDWKPLTIEINP
jgi:predicted phosphodiesterase